MSDWLDKPEFPRSARYDADWVLDNQMGPNALWLVEWLTAGLALKPGMRVLDLGCGRAMTSIFLAREFDVRVWAADLWVDADDNWQRVVAAGLQERICPLRAEAHALPFAAGFFDAVVSVDALHYFGTDTLYLHYLTRFLRDGGLLGMVVPGLMQPITGELPPHLVSPQANGTAFWEDECWSFETADSWRLRWQRSGRLDGVHVDTLADGWRHWRDFELAVEASGKGRFPSCAEALDADAGRWIGLVRAVAQATGGGGVNYYKDGLAD